LTLVTFSPTAHQLNPRSSLTFGDDPSTLVT
jgi:hypothetical protein